MPKALEILLRMIAILNASYSKTQLLVPMKVSLMRDAYMILEQE